jgi:putative hemolysin
MTPLLLAAALLLVISAFLSAAETATFAVGNSRLRTLLEEGFRGAEDLSALRDRGRTVQPSLLLLNTLANVGIAGLLVGAAAYHRGVAGAAIGIPMVALLILVVGELLPRFVAVRNPIRFALASASTVLVLEKWAKPIFFPLERLDDYWSNRNGDDARSVEEREVRELAVLGRLEGVVGEEEHELVERAFRLDELVAWDIMTPRVDIFAWRDSMTLEEIIGELRNVPYSRVPVFGESVDDITGILHVREAYETYVAGRNTLTLAEVSREPFFVPGSLSLTRLLKDFQIRRIHMGIVADEFGGTDGLVTLEDVLEELVGEIVDETDVAEEALFRVSKNELVVPGGAELREINYSFNVSLPHMEHRSLNGFVLEELGRVPEPGERIERNGILIEILEASETQVLRARLKKLAMAGGEETE